MSACEAVAMSAGPVVTLAGIEGMCRELTDGEASPEDVAPLLDAVRRHVMAHGVVCDCPGPRGRPVPAAVRPVEGREAAGGGQSAPERRKAPRKRSQRLQPHQVTDPQETARICRLCLVIRGIDEFGPTLKGVKGRRTACRVCENARKRDARRAARRSARSAGT